MKEKILREWNELRVLTRSVPSYIVAVFALSLFAMNLLANKSVNLGVDWLALDCGICVSWIAFLSMDVVTKRFGPKAATQLSVFVLLISLAFCGLLAIAGVIPGTWGESYNAEDGAAVNSALDATFGGTWYVLLGSAAAFLISAAVNNVINWAVGGLFRRRPDGAAAFFARSYISTAAGQFVDNIVFALIVSHSFFGWSLLQCVTCSLTGMLAELLCEVVFSPLGLALCRRWEKEDVGAEYIRLRAENATDGSGKIKAEETK